MSDSSAPFSRSYLYVLTAAAAAIAIGVIAWKYPFTSMPTPNDEKPRLKYQPRTPIDASGFSVISGSVDPWLDNASLERVAKSWDRIGYRLLEDIERELKNPNLHSDRRKVFMLKVALLHAYEGESLKAYDMLAEFRKAIEADDSNAEASLYTTIYFQGVMALRRGEDENCIMCRDESSCILPIDQAAIHTKPEGSRLAIKHFTEYLAEFPDDLEVQYLLNLAHMTLGEYPQKVDPKHLIKLTHYEKSEFDIGKFRDIGHLAGVIRPQVNQAGGAVMEDFHGKGLLDIAITSWDATQPMALFRNKGDGTFEDVSAKAGLTKQLGGLNLVQTDFNNDGHMDLFVPRGAWWRYSVRPSLLRNNGNGTFTDVTEQAGLALAMNSNCAAWADVDNDGFLDVYVCGEQQPSRLYRNKSDGTFEDLTEKSGLPTEKRYCKGATWLDFNNDGYPDLFLSYFPNAGDAEPRSAALYRNNRDGTFTDVSKEMGIDGPYWGFSAWAFDFDNDGYLDIFATSYDRSLKDIILGMQGKAHEKKTSKLYRNLKGKGFQDVTREAGLYGCFATMGSNFGDFDNDGYLDFYLGTGEPSLATLVPNRMFKNVAGKRFAEITASSRTGHLQKGHGVAIGDWRRTGTVDIFIETGGATNGDKYHNVLFMNPGQGNHWLTVKLVGAMAKGDPPCTTPGKKKTNRAAIGARIQAITTGENSLSVHRHVNSGSTFGGNPLQQTLGLGKATMIDKLIITWPTSGTTQVFRDVAVDQAIEITEFATAYRKLDWKPLPTPK
ncbi:MAG: CRTAC1 family protein [Planctomycetes bacterium]|nr:CRTAC1 family protein [Planctomycetota bacterium]